MTSVEEIIQRWKTDRPVYKGLCKYVKAQLKAGLYDEGLYAEVTGRLKETVSLLKKVKSKSDKGTYTYENATDKLGVRIVCNYKEQLPFVDKIVKERFDIKKFEDKAEGLEENEFSYTSWHYDLSVKADAPVEYHSLIFELQVRTINQHAWACTAHELSYKQEISLPKLLKRKVFRLSALHEIADGELSTLNDYVSNHEEFEPFKLLKLLEAPFYQTAKMDFNKTLTFEFSKKVLDANLFSFEIDYQTFLSFIESNKPKIKHIFKEYRQNPAISYIISQPETLLVWYLLQKIKFQFKDFFEENYDQEELNIMENCWGVIE